MFKMGSVSNPLAPAFQSVVCRSRLPRPGLHPLLQVFLNPNYLYADFKPKVLPTNRRVLSMMYSKPSRNAFANPFLARVYPDPTLAQFHPRLLPLVYFQSCVLPHVHLLLDFGIELFQTIQGCVNSQCGLYYTMRKNTAVRHPTSQRETMHHVSDEL